MGVWYDKLAKDSVDSNKEARKRIRLSARGNPKRQKELMDACREDVMFFFAAFLWVFEPRPEDGSRDAQTYPFLLWPDEELLVRTCDENLGHSDIRVNKGRAQGFTWVVAGMAVWYWLFVARSQVGLVSKNEDTVDNPDDPGSLMWKIDFLISMLPQWMLPEGFEPSKHRKKSTHTLVNPANKAIIVGFAATSNVGTGGRYTWFGFDELSKWERGNDQRALDSTMATTKSRLIGSSPFGDSGAFYRLIHELSDAPMVTMHWHNNPVQNRGMYRYVDGQCVEIDADNPLPPGYEVKTRPLLNRLLARGFKLEGTIRSPWYDRECDRLGATPYSIAQEHDLSFGGATEKAFGDTFAERARVTCCQPRRRCNFLADPEEGFWDFDDSLSGHLSLWLPMDGNDRVPPTHKFVVSADIAAGTGGSHTSNSVAAIIDETEMRQVGELVSNSLSPVKFADMCYCLCLWLNNARFIWETNGPTGQAFTLQFLKYDYPNIYRRTKKHRRTKTKSREPGWLTPAAAGLTPQFEQLQNSVLTGELKLSSEELVLECRQYEWEGGKIVHAGAKNTESASSKGLAHGDRAVAMALALHDILDRKGTTMTRAPIRMIDADAEYWEKEALRERMESGDWMDPLSGLSQSGWLN